MKNLFTTLPVLLVLLTNFAVVGQSTSNWVKVKSTFDQVDVEPISKNGSYISIKIVNERIYHKSNWWTNLISKNKKAFVTIDVKADYPNNKSLEDRRNSEMISIQSKEKPIDLGWSQYIVREIPATFSSIKLNITLNSTSEDGADKVVNVASDLSKKIPALSIAQSYMGIVSGTKLLLDEIFNKNLASNYLKSNNELIAAAQNNIAPGYYVVFGGQFSSDYQNYISDPTKLYWDGTQLKFDDRPIENLNYFVILIDSKKSMFPVKDIDILSNTETTWSKFYIEANQQIEFMQTNEIDKTAKKVNELLASAKMILDNDPSYIFSEKEAMHASIRMYLKLKFDMKRTGLDNGDVFRLSTID